MFSVKFFRFASVKDVALTIIGALAAIVKGPAYLVTLILYADMLEGFMAAEKSPNTALQCNATNISRVESV